MRIHGGVWATRITRKRKFSGWHQTLNNSTLIGWKNRYLRMITSRIKGWRMPVPCMLLPGSTSRNLMDSKISQNSTPPIFCKWMSAVRADLIWGWKWLILRRNTKWSLPSIAGVQRLRYWLQPNSAFAAMNPSSNGWNIHATAPLAKRVCIPFHCRTKSWLTRSKYPMEF